MAFFIVFAILSLMVVAALRPVRRAPIPIPARGRGGVISRAIPSQSSAKRHVMPYRPSMHRLSGLAALLGLLVGGARGKVLRRIDVPGSVHHVVVSPDGRFAAATHPGGAEVSVVDLDRAEVLATIPVGDDPNHAVFTRGGAGLAVSVAGEDVIALIDTADWRITARIAVGASPEHIVLSPDGTRFYVNAVDDGSVSEINMATRKQVRTIALKGSPLHGLDLTDDGGALIASILGDDAVARIDLASGTVIRAALAPAPYHVAAAHGSGKVYVSSAAAPGLTVLSPNDLSVIGRVETGGGGHQAVSLAVSPLVGGKVQ
ncbi:MAG: YVTN family beta-propeller protein [Paracoccaceae bacterium]|jgi:YVTN family beta-propeller protein